MHCKSLWIYSPMWAVSHRGADWLKQRLHFQVHLLPCLYYFCSFVGAPFSSPPQNTTHFTCFYWRVHFVIRCQPKIFYVEKDRKKIRKILDLPKWIKPSQKQNYQPSQDFDIQIPRYRASPLKLINYSSWTIATEKSVCFRGKVLCSRTT